MNSRSGQAMASRVLVVIVNYRSAPWAVECLRSLVPEIAAHPGARAVVVDNCSPDDSVAVLRAAIRDEGWSAWATLMRSTINGGFVHGNNLAIGPALRAPQPPDVIWLLNPDTRVRPGAMAAMLAFLAAHPQVGILGSGLDEGDGQPWPYAFRFPSAWSELEQGARLGLLTRLLQGKVVARRMPEQPTRVDWVPGASMMVRRQVFESAGLMDDDYFLYFEETDFCLQAKRAGWSCWYLPQARVVHVAGQSTGVTAKKAEATPLPDYWFESRRRYFVKNHGRLYAIVADLLWMGGFALWRLRRRLQRKADTDPPGMLRAFFHHSALFHARLPAGPGGRVGIESSP